MMLILLTIDIGSISILMSCVVETPIHLIFN
jgi:hypothetical protein